MHRRAVLPVAAALLALAGCGGARVTASDVETRVAEQVQSRIGERPDVSCPDDLDAEVGATTRCSLTVAGVAGTYGVTVKVTKVQDDRAQFDITVDRRPQG